MTDYEQKSLAMLQFIAKGIDIQLAMAITSYEPVSAEHITADQRRSNVSTAVMRYTEELARLNLWIGNLPPAS